MPWSRSGTEKVSHLLNKTGSAGLQPAPIREGKPSLAENERSRNPFQDCHRNAEGRNEEHCQMHGLAVETLLKFGAET